MSITTTAEPAPRPSRHVSCTDGLNRQRRVTLHTATGHVVLITPPAEAAVLTPDQARELGHQLFELANQLEPERRGPVFGLRPGS